VEVVNKFKAHITFIGRVIKTDPKAAIEIFPQYQKGLQGLTDFSHIYLIYWLDQIDTPEARKTLQVHPRGNQANPLTGVFATRSPVRPNPVALIVTELLGIKNGIVYVGHIDAFEGTPIVDIKPYLPSGDRVSAAKVADWV
jgi:tRNA-Thr(GGU) m(6)t(6)A37 methyltransferase TsaA